MKKNLVLIALMSVVLFCSNNRFANNGGTNDETSLGTNTMIYEPDGKTPAVGAVVKLFKVNTTDGQYVSKQITDTNGRYSIAQVPEGQYNVWAEKDSNVTLQDSVIITSTQTTLHSDTLECPSSLTGIVGVQPQHDPRTVTIQVVGSDKYFNNVDGNGRFTMTGLAGGKYNLLLKSTLPDYTPTSSEASVDKCSNDSLKDTLWLIYTGIPVALGLQATYDTLNGLVHLSWNKSGFRDLQSYVIYRDFYDSVNLSANPIASQSDTIFIDTIFKRRLSSGQFSFSDAKDYHFKYRVAIRNNLNVIGQTFRYVDIIAASPAKVKTTFFFTIFHIAKKFLTDSASINDTLRYTAQVDNTSRNLRRILWTDLGSGKIIRTRNLDTTARIARDTLFYVWGQIGKQKLECKVIDVANTEWSDTVGVAIVVDAPVVNLATTTPLVPTRDTIRLSLATSDKYGKVVRCEWDIGNTGTFTVSTAKDTTMIAPSEPISKYLCLARVTDDDGNVVTDTVAIRVKMFACATNSAGFSVRLGLTSVVFNNKMWVIGGQEGFPRGGEGKNDVWYSEDGISWYQATNAAAFSGRSLLTSLVYDNKMWVIGGQEGYPGERKNDVWYSTDGANWTEATDSAAFSPRCGHSSVVFDNKMWVIGGTGPSDVWYSSDGIAWTMATNTAGFLPRYLHTSVVFDNKMWVIGGDSQIGNDVWYSSDGKIWTQAVEASAFPARQGHSSLVFGNKMWVFSGGPGDGSGLSFSDAWYSLDGATWTMATDSTGFSIRAFHTNLVFNSKIWIIAGRDNSGISGYEGYHNDVWYYQPAN